MIYQENEFDKLKVKVLYLYKKLLLKHLLKRLCFGVLSLASFVLAAILLEHFLYLNVWLRTILFYFFLIGSGYLLLIGLGIPMLKILNIIKAPSLKSLSKMISHYQSWLAITSHYQLQLVIIIHTQSLSQAQPIGIAGIWKETAYCQSPGVFFGTDLIYLATD